MANYGIKIDLLKLKNSFVTNIKGKAATKRCLVIPLDDSGVFLGEKGAYLSLTAVEMREPRYDDTHLVKQSLSKEVYQAMTEDERKAQPILGSLKPIEVQQRQMDVTTTTEVDVSDGDFDDLPF